MGTLVERTTGTHSRLAWMPYQYLAIDGGHGAHLLAALAGRNPHVRQVASPRHANLLIVVEPINQMVLPAIIEIAKALPRPAHALLVRTDENGLDQFAGIGSASLEESLPGSRRITANTAGTLLDAVLHTGQWTELNPPDASEFQEEAIQLPAKVEQEMATELAVLSLGPVQPFTAGPLRLFLICDGEQVVSARVESGYAYRGIAQVMMQAEWQRGLVLARSLDPLAPIACQLAYVRALEHLQGWLPPVQVAMLREAAVALERVQNVLWWGARFMSMLDDAPLAERFYALATALEECRSLLWQGSATTWIAPQRNPASSLAGRSGATDRLKQVLRGSEALRKNVEGNRWLLLRTRGKGVLSAQRLHFAGVRGPVLRASERGNGDVQSRLVARLDAEVNDLARAVEALATREESPAHDAEWRVPAGETSVVVQGPRGEIGLHVVSDGGERPAHIEWQRPSEALLPLLPEILAGQKLTDAEAILASLDLAMAEADGWMNTIVLALWVIVCLLVGTYGMAVLQQLILLGPRRVSTAFQWPVVNALRLLRQENLMPRGADRFLFRSAPFIALAVMSLTAPVIPLGPHLIVFDPSVGLFYFIVLLSPFVVSLMNAGWSQNSKEGLFSTFRAAAYLVSYEVPIGFAAIGPVMAAQSLSTQRIVETQAGLWYVVWQPLGLVIYLLAALFVTFRHPFDSALAGDELEGGVFAEYAGPRLLLFKIALDAIFLILMSMGVVLFFGGWQGPWLPAPAWFVLKTFLLAVIVLWATRFLPRLRHDQILSLSWKILPPASLLNITLVGILALFIPGGGR